MMQAETAKFLSELSQALNEMQRRKLHNQQEIKQGTGVDQTIISRAKTGKFKRVTENLKRLKKYADMLVSSEEVPHSIRGATKEFYGAGGTEDELIASIKLVTNLIGRRMR